MFIYMAYINSKIFKETSPADKDAIKQQLLKEAPSYLANEYEALLLTGTPLSTLRKNRSSDRGLPFVKTAPLTTISNKPAKDNRKRSSSSSVRYPLAQIFKMTGVNV